MARTRVRSGIPARCMPEEIQEAAMNSYKVAKSIRFGLDVKMGFASSEAHVTWPITSRMLDLSAAGQAFVGRRHADLIHQFTLAESVVLHNAYVCSGSEENLLTFTMQGEAYTENLRVYLSHSRNQKAERTEERLVGRFESIIQAVAPFPDSYNQVLIAGWCGYFQETLKRAISKKLHEPALLTQINAYLEIAEGVVESSLKSPNGLQQLDLSYVRKKALEVEKAVVDLDVMPPLEDVLSDESLP